MRLFIALCLLSSTAFATPSVGAAETAEQMQRRFLSAIAAGQDEKAYSQMHPSLQELVDPPVFGAWVKAVSKKLGRLKEIETTTTSRKQMLAGVQVEIHATLEFDHGNATSELSFFDGRLIAFHVQSDELGDWFQGPTGVEIYEQRSQEFIGAFFAQDVGRTRSMMHEALREVVSAEQLQEMMSQTESNAGRMISAELRDHRMEFDDGRQTLTLVFDMACADAAGEFELEFQFVGMKGHLLAFRIR